ncbi:hypothetical protein GGX14DRAFT_393009 [Mycena pura]|uniref:Uncharacterized protein n=1 Tax=Mycena pura TaxID=153505 RepID=A0AAD6YCH5_9AGAR|nr:hypothetical protein GGX14DRAFT_393009 [Mycena pura]
MSRCSPSAPHQRRMNGRASVIVLSPTSGLPQHGSAALPIFPLDQSNVVHNEPSLQAASGLFLPAASPTLAPNGGVLFLASTFNYWPSSPHTSSDISASSPADLDLPYTTLSHLNSTPTNTGTGQSIVGETPVYALPSLATDAAGRAFSESGAEFDVNRIPGQQRLTYITRSRMGIWPWELDIAVDTRTDEMINSEAEAPFGAGASYDNLCLAATTASRALESTLTGEAVTERDPYLNAASSPATAGPLACAGHSNSNFNIERFMEHSFPETTALDEVPHFGRDERGMGIWPWAGASTSTAAGARRSFPSTPC